MVYPSELPELSSENPQGEERTVHRRICEDLRGSALHREDRVQSLPGQEQGLPEIRCRTLQYHSRAVGRTEPPQTGFQTPRQDFESTCPDRDPDDAIA